jgi:hypothetical protein
MTSAWTKRFLLGCCLVWPVACVVSVGDDGDIDDIDDGVAGGTNRAGSGGSSGSNGSSGNSGTAGTMSMIGNGGTGGSDLLPTPVCSEETEDDDCLSCIKQECCVQWQACNTTTCQEQREVLVECVDGMGDSDLYNDVCVPLAAEPDDFLAANTQALMTCVNERITEGDAGIVTTRCGVQCFGEDLFME